MIRAALFDVDGTLLDSSAFHVAAWQRAFAEFGIEVPERALWQQMGNGGDQLVKALCSPSQQLRFREQLIQRHVDIFSRDYLDRVRPFPDVRALFERLHEDGVKIALASSAQEWERDRHIEILGIGDLLDAATSGEAVEHAKPAPDVFKAALAQLPRITPRSTVVIGDSPYDAAAARSAGMQAIGLLSGRFTKKRLWKAGARCVLRDISDLLAAYGQVIAPHLLGRPALRSARDPLHGA